MNVQDSLQYGFSYQHDFITPEEEIELMKLMPKPPKAGYGLQKSRRWRYGTGKPYQKDFVSVAIPDHLLQLAKKILDAGLIEKMPDSISINEYLAGQGNNAHIDNPESGKVITSLSLCGSCNMVLIHPTTSEKVVFDFPPRTLTQLRDSMRYNWKHGIFGINSLRYAIVFRDSTNL